ncbi:MAG TPA: cytochrome d ubiquinol oxidase subunit II [Smithella sp.]|nr:cytochrome d ubiquinol oxidase subunit II [Smithella sp.]HQI23465.1 cytochrome d ubiquinol oxidase subunit II [Smithella sp.]HQL97932.1 cytochrome d ubiquinol oxidase subunit II [Smithella sp.]HQP41354.1 cytochrome d ubiquinol oxidase subunit II [Smithella sp.]
MDNIQCYQELWFVLILVLLMGYSLLDGFDLGIGALLPFLGKTKEEKDILINSIGPVWDGNEVWLITGGGALFAAFPHAYATAFSGFYLAMMLVLFALIFRAVSMEFRAHDEKRSLLWEKAFIAGSALAALLFGVALGNVVYGVPLDDQMEFTGNFFTLLRPVPLMFGVTGFAAVLLQGAAYAVMKTEGELRERSFRAVSFLTVINLITAMIYFGTIAFTFDDIVTNWLFYLAFMCTVLWLSSIFFSVRHKNDSAPFWESSFAFIGLWLVVAAVHFPNLIRASNDQSMSLTIYNSSTSLLTLKVMSVIALIGMPIVIAYTIFVYRIFKGKTKSSSHY